MRSTQPQSERLFWSADLNPKLQSGDGETAEVKRSRKIAPEQEANLIGSLTTNGLHMPVLDIDRINVKVLPSSTPGNFHLYIDKEMDWETYAELLKAMEAAGILEPGYVSASLDRKATFVRKPGVKKDALEALEPL